MKNKILLATAFIMALFMTVSCSKDEETITTPPATSGTGGTGGTGGTDGTAIAGKNMVVYKGKTITLTDVSWSKNTGKHYEMYGIVKTADTTFTINVSFPDFQRATGSCSFANNVMPLPAGKASFSYMKSKDDYFGYVISANDLSGTCNYVKTATGFQAYANNIQTFAGIGIPGVALGGAAGKMSFNLSIDNATLPSANTAYTVPTGLTEGTFNFGGTTYTTGTSNNSYRVDKDGTFKVEVNNGATVPSLVAPTFGISAQFKDRVPASGTYDVVASIDELASGKVYIANGFLFGKAKAGQKVVVVNNDGELNIYFKDLAFQSLFGPDAGTGSGWMKH